MRKRVCQNCRESLTGNASKWCGRCAPHANRMRQTERRRRQGQGAQFFKKYLMSKSCSGCGSIKPIDQFGLRPNSRGYMVRRYQCRTCQLWADGRRQSFHVWVARHLSIISDLAEWMQKSDPVCQNCRTPLENRRGGRRYCKVCKPHVARMRSNSGTRRRIFYQRYRPGAKWCSGCERMLLIGDDFHEHNGRNGRTKASDLCRPCYNRRNADYQLNKPQGRLAYNIRQNVRYHLKGDKPMSFSKALGCTRAELSEHMERQFEPGMSWDNYGDGWHADHIIPLSYFDLTDKGQFKEASHYTNLQPLWAEDNIEKGDTLPDGLQQG